MLSLKNVTIRVEQKTIIQNLSLQVDAGSLHVIMGQNGSGKSSLAYSLMGHPSYDMVQGSMEFCKQDLSVLSMQDRSKQGIFLAFQQPLAIPGVTVLQFLKEIYAVCDQDQVSPADFQTILQNILEQVGLDTSFLYRGLNENFSGGEKKRLEIVQMLLLKPQLIILDEIDSGLDVDALRAIGTAVDSYLQSNISASCIVITHYRRILDYLRPNFVHVMHAGNIVRSGDAQLSYEIEEKGYDSYGR